MDESGDAGRRRRFIAPIALDDEYAARWAVRPLSNEHMLWLAVLEQAIADLNHIDRLTGRRAAPRLSRTGRLNFLSSAIQLRSWLDSKSMRVGGFSWICDLFDFDHRRIRSKLLPLAILLVERGGRMVAETNIKKVLPTTCLLVDPGVVKGSLFKPKK